MKEFNVSTNIIRDQYSDLNYIVTKNSKENFDKIAANFKSNNKFQAIIGSYGTGKSSFLWAFEKNLTGEKNYFNSLANNYSDVASFQFIKLVGEYKPISISLAKTLNLNLEDENIEDTVIEHLENIISKNTKKKIATVFLFDEFGKFPLIYPLPFPIL